MTLPKIDRPKFTLKMPSNDKKISYVPFSVKDEKALLLAKESEDFEQIIECMKSIIESCTISPKNIKADELPIFDVEYYFLNLRSKSIGDKIDLYIKHSKNIKESCTHEQKITIDLNDVNIIKESNHTKNIMLTNNIGVSMKYLGLKDIYKIQKMQDSNSKNQSDMDTVLDIICDSIEFIFEDKKTYNINDVSKDELKEWLESLSESQILKLRNFFDTYPKLKHEINYTCSKCGQEDKIILEGINSFFG